MTSLRSKIRKHRKYIERKGGSYNPDILRATSDWLTQSFATDVATGQLKGAAARDVARELSDMLQFTITWA